jgi:tRNA pseudouridine55 synthase
MNGILIIDKPAGMTSHDVVKRVRKICNTAKVGHLGTLDPMATGVLPVCVGQATRIGQFIPASPKEYTGQIRFGFSTTTYDREGTPTDVEQPFHASREEIEQAAIELTGIIDQVPPPISAKKHGGVPSYKLARTGRPVENPPARVHVYEFHIEHLEAQILTFRVSCSAGTYVRSLAHDLGLRFGCGAHLTSLRRMRSGEFTAADATSLETLSARDLVPMERLLESLPLIEVSGREEERIAHGNAIPTETAGRLARIFNKRGQLLAIAAIENGFARPRLVLTSITSDRKEIQAMC